MRSPTALVVRVHGAATHLLHHQALRDIAACHDLRELSQRLVTFGYLAPATPGESPSARAIELACRQMTAERIALLERWTFGRAQTLRPFTLREDVRSTRALVLGAASQLPPEARLRALVATPDLPLRALNRLATVNEPRAVAALLAVWNHPLATAVAAALRGDVVESWGLDRELLTVWSAQARRSTRWASASFVAFVREEIDLANIVAARLLVEQGADVAVDDLFVPGGARVSRDALAMVVRSRRLDPLADRLACDPDARPLMTALTSNAADIEGEVLTVRIDRAAWIVRRDPLDDAAIVSYFLRLRAEHRTIVMAAWRCALGIGVTSAQKAAA